MSKVIKLGNYKEIEVNVKRQPVTQEEIDSEINRLLAQSNSLEDKEGLVEHGDVTTIDFEGFKDGVAFDGGKAEGFQLEIGSGQFIPGFEDQMIGMSKGETRELNLTFPENYGAADLAGADVVFKVTVHNIGVKKQAELNDEFVKSFNIPEMNNVDDLQNNIKASIEAHHEQMFNADKENKVMEKLINDSEVEVEDDDIQRAMEQHLNHLTHQIASQGMQLDQYLQMIGMDQETLKQQLLPAATQQAKFEAIIDEIVAVENLQTTDEELDSQVEMIANHNQVSKEEVLEKVSAEDLKRDLNRIQASQLILTSAKIVEE